MRHFSIANSDGSNSVRWCSMSVRSKAKIGCSIARDEHVQCPLDVRSTVRRTFSEHQIAMKNAFSRWNISLFWNFWNMVKTFCKKSFWKDLFVILDRIFFAQVWFLSFHSFNREKKEKKLFSKRRKCSMFVRCPFEVRLF